MHDISVAVHRETLMRQTAHSELPLSVLRRP